MLFQVISKKIEVVIGIDVQSQFRIKSGLGTGEESYDIFNETCMPNRRKSRAGETR